jgi:regulator of replication initiation timing
METPALTRMREIYEQYENGNGELTLSSVREFFDRFASLNNYLLGVPDEDRRKLIRQVEDLETQIEGRNRYIKSINEAHDRRIQREREISEARLNRVTFLEDFVDRNEKRIKNLTKQVEDLKGTSQPDTPTNYERSVEVGSLRQRLKEAEELAEVRLVRAQEVEEIHQWCPMRETLWAAEEKMIRDLKAELKRVRKNVKKALK